MNYPEYVKIDDKEYKINTDFRVAIECNEIALDNEINDYERALAIIYKLFGDEGLNDFENHNKLLELAQKYFGCGKKIKNKNKKEEPDFDFEQDMNLVRISFMSDYNGLDIKDKKMHFWEFMDRINGLSNSELGNCCILNRIRYFRNLDLKTIKNPKERENAREIKEQFSLKKKNNKKQLTQEELNNINDFLSKIRKE